MKLEILLEEVLKKKHSVISQTASFYLDYLIATDPSTQYNKIPQPKSSAEHTDFTRAYLKARGGTSGPIGT